MISWHRIVYYTANKNMINMKQAILNPAKTISLLFAFMIISIITFAQDKKIDVNVNVTYSLPEWRARLSAFERV